MMFKALKKFVADQQQIQQRSVNAQTNQLSSLNGLPFYIWDEEEHQREHIKKGDLCCFNHAISLPVKHGVTHRLYDYEKLAFDTIFKEDGSIKDKHTLILKASGIGISELVLRIVAWLCFKDDTLAGSQIALITGPRIDLSVALMERLKNLFYAKNLITSFESKETVAILNNVRVECFPSHHLSAMRGISNVSMIVADEASFFLTNEQRELRDTIERYIGKSSAYIILISTPNKPGDLMQEIGNESEDVCIYRRLQLPWTVAVGKIFTVEEMQKAQASPSWAREYELKFSGLIGNSFTQSSIDAAIEKGRNYNPDAISTTTFSKRSMGIDPAYGSSNFAVVITEYVDGIIHILYSDEFSRPDYNDMLNKVFELMSKYDINKVYVDGANPSFIKSLKIETGENPEYLEELAQYKSQGLDEMWWTKDMKIIPVNFNKEAKAMLGHCKMILEDDGGRVAINPIFDKLIIALRTCTDVEGVVDKESTSFDDTLDALRLSLKYYRFEEA